LTNRADLKYIMLAIEQEVLEKISSLL